MPNLIASAAALLLALAAAPEGVQDLLREDWSAARHDLLRRAAEGHRLEVLRELDGLWRDTTAPALRARIAAVTDEIEAQWVQAEREREWALRVADLARALEAGGADAASPDVRSAVEALVGAAGHTPETIAAQGYFPFGPAAPRASVAPEEGATQVLVGADGERYVGRVVDGKVEIVAEGSTFKLVNDAAPQREDRAHHDGGAAGDRTRVGLPWRPEDRDRVIEDGLDFLVAAQTGDGCWPDPPRRSHDTVFDTSLAALALLAGGAEPGQGPRGTALDRAARWLVERVGEDGRLRVARPSDRPWEEFECWYAATAALVLAEFEARESRPEVRRALERLGRRLVALERRTGGWTHGWDFRLLESGGWVFAHYSEDLLAVTNLVVAALTRMAEEGVTVDGWSRATVLAYYRENLDPSGGFRYGLHHGWSPSREPEPGRTAGALFALGRLPGTPPAFLDGARAYVAEEVAGLPVSPGHGGTVFTLNYLVGALGCHATPRLWRAFQGAHFGFLVAAAGADGAIPLTTGHWDDPVNNTAIAVIALALDEGHLVLSLPPE